MTPRRDEQSDDRFQSKEHLSPVIASEVMRASASRHHFEPTKPAEEKISLFWRIFGGTILSIVALLIITAYQSVSSSIHDLQGNIAQINEAKADFVKKDEHASSRTRTWERMTEIQKEIASVAGPMTQLKDRVGHIEEQAKSQSAERKEILELQATGKERMVQFEQQLTALKAGQKDVAALQQALSALQEKSALRDQQLKQIEDERKDLLKEVQALRERLARMEATRETKPAASDKAARPGSDN